MKNKKNIASNKSNSENIFSFYCGRVIKRIRREKGISGFELGIKLSISQQQISRYERGLSKLNVDMLINIADTLNTPLDTIIKLTFEEMKKNIKLKSSDNIYPPG